MIFQSTTTVNLSVNGDAIHTVDRKRNETGINTSVLQRINNSRTVLFAQGIILHLDDGFQNNE